MPSVLFIDDEPSVRTATATLRVESLQALREVAGFVREQSGPILIEAHSDDVPVSSAVFASNWELTAARSARLARFLVEELNVDSTRISAVGFAGSRPLVDNADEESRAANRRVELVLVTEDVDGPGA